MPQPLVNGVFAAVLTPRDADGRLDEAYLSRNLEFLSTQGIRGLVLNGATGEYALNTAAELKRIFTVARQVTAGKTTLLCGIGAAGLRGALECGRIGLDGGAAGLLLPPPHFFPYAPDDVEAYCRAVAGEFSAPILLYNIPKFTSALTWETARNLLESCPNIVGIKDSSGSLDILRNLTESGMGASRVVGSDEALAAALREKVVDAVISGVAGVLPEPVVALFQAGKNTDSAEFHEASRHLGEFLGAIAGMPVPWALKWIAEARGLGPGTFEQPVSRRRAAQGSALRAWFDEWQQKPEGWIEYAKTRCAPAQV